MMHAEGERARTALPRAAAGPKPFCHWQSSEVELALALLFLLPVLAQGRSVPPHLPPHSQNLQEVIHSETGVPALRKVERV